MIFTPKTGKHFFSFLTCFLLLLSSDENIYAEEVPAKDEHVIILHGMGRSYRAMKKIEENLLKNGYHVTNLNYPSTKKTIEKIASEDLHKAVTDCLSKKASAIHVVTHSLGGIVLRQYLQKNKLPDGSRAVMLAPPNSGSEIPDFLKENMNLLYKRIMGPPGQALGTDPSSKPNTLSPVQLEIGIIAGNKDSLPIFSSLFDKPNDGKVSVESTKLEEMTDFIVVPCGHTFIMNDDSVNKQILHFLKNGFFDKNRSH